MITLVLDFKKIPSDDKTLYSSFYLNSIAKKIINESDINDVFKWIFTTIISNIQKYVVPGSGWIINSFILQSFNNSKYNLLAGSSYYKIRKESDHPRKVSINILNIDDNRCFKWCLVRYLHTCRVSSSKNYKGWQRIYFKGINAQ